VKQPIAKHHVCIFLQLLVFAIFTFQAQASGPGADLIIFSFDRPMQLYALLESVKKHMQGVNATAVIYRTTDEAYEQAYQEVKDTFSNVIYVQQGINPQEDFKLLTMQAFCLLGSPYVLFAVDDMIVKDDVDLNACIEHMEREGAYGFYLRLGKNTTFSYPYKVEQGIPSTFELVADDVCKWQLGSGRYCWGYPHTVDMTVYRKADIFPYLRGLAYASPNQLEGNWSCYWRNCSLSWGLCFEQSKVLNIPLNCVQKVTKENPHMGSYSPAELRELFEAGFKIDIEPLYRFENRSAHTDFDITFTLRRCEHEFVIN
jgi:hypothetical protein